MSNTVDNKRQSKKKIHVKGLMITVDNWVQFDDADEEYEHQFTFELDRRNKVELKRVLKRMFKDDEKRKKLHYKRLGYN